MKQHILYSKFERFWHWTQMALIVLLLITGFEIHGNISVFGFEKSVRLHNSAAWSFIGLTAITIFWMLTVGQWKHFIPSRNNYKKQIRYYAYGIFKNEPSPHGDKTNGNKFNPIQRLVYLSLLVVAFPAQIITGLLYFYFRYPGNPVDSSTFEIIASIHTLLAFLLVSFLLLHIYMTTTGKKINTYVKEMVTGLHEIDETQENIKA